MLVFAAFTPHSPLLLPNIGKENLKQLEQTSTAMQHLADDLYSAQPDTIVVISGHNLSYPDAFAMSLNDSFQVDLTSLGDLVDEKTYYPDLALIDSGQRRLRNKEFPFSLDPDDTLDYGSAVPLLLLTEALKSFKIVPISPSDLGPKEHFKFGKALKELILESPQRIAVIASGDLAHTLNNDSPAGFHKNGAKFDEKIQELVAGNNVAGLIKMKPELVADAKQCGYRAILILFGILDKMNFRTNIMSYEAPLGVGYLTVKFELG